MQIFIIVPCLNEEESLAASCRSLGFGTGTRPPGKLVLVDNGSSDDTLTVMSEICASSPPGQVLVVQQPRRGHVAARHAGVLAAAEQTRLDGQASEHTLILQADADTLYLPGYVDAMRAACDAPRGQLLEGSALTAREFNARYAGFTRLCREVDTAMEHWFAPETDQVVVDDKVSGFILADYLDWGGHQDDQDLQGAPVLAETTRLFMRAKRRGNAYRCRVEAAQALPSRRKLLTNAAAYFASSGFPRGPVWNAAWEPVNEGTHFLESPFDSPGLDRLINARQRHQLALFGLLPALFHRRPTEPAALRTMVSTLRTTASDRPPGETLGHLLTLADQGKGEINALLCSPWP